MTRKSALAALAAAFLLALASVPAAAADAKPGVVPPSILETAPQIPTTKVPVLSRLVRPGEIIAPSDLAWITMRSDRVSPDTLTNVSDIVGRTPRWPIRMQQPLQVGQIERPVVIHRNDAVTVELQTRAMDLTMEGTALDDGVKGAVIRVLNVKSKRVVQAVAMGPGRAAASLPGAAPALSASGAVE